MQRSSEHLPQICGAKAGRIVTDGAGEKQRKKREEDDLSTTTRDGGSGHGGGIDGTLQLILAELWMIRMERAEERVEMAKMLTKCNELRAVVAQQQ